MNRLQDKVAIITGAGGGICHEAAKLFCQEGAKYSRPRRLNRPSLTVPLPLPAGNFCASYKNPLDKSGEAVYS